MHVTPASIGLFVQICVRIGTLSRRPGHALTMSCSFRISEFSLTTLSLIVRRSTQPASFSVPSVGGLAAVLLSCSWPPDHFRKAARRLVMVTSHLRKICAEVESERKAMASYAHR